MTEQQLYELLKGSIGDGPVAFSYDGTQIQISGSYSDVLKLVEKIFVEGYDSGYNQGIVVFEEDLTLEDIVY
jgi:hypothetical protein